MNPRPGTMLRKPSAAVLMFIASASVASSGAAQSRPDTMPRAVPDTAAAQNRLAAPLLDVPIRRAEYRLGPGDVLGISIVGDVSRSISAVVSPEGIIALPGIGGLNVLGTSIDEAEVLVRSKVLEFFRNVRVSLRLEEVRRFKVFVVGNVAVPGVATASAATRVSELVGGIDENGVHRRNVVLGRAGGDTLVVDLAQFFLSGDLASNPRVREGDVLIVPYIDRLVHVYGRVPFAGSYEFRAGETLAQLLTTVTGGQGLPAHSADSVRVSRFIDDERRTVVVLSQADAAGAAGNAFVLEPFDAVFIAEQGGFKAQKTAQVNGEVWYPGTYPIDEGVTTVRELIQTAGGLRPDAALDVARLERAAPQDSMIPRVRDLPVEMLSERDRRVQQILTTSMTRTVAASLDSVFVPGSAEYSITLRHGDVLTVPRLRLEVTVLGAVVSPGIVPFAAARPLTFFVQRAGGFGRRADRSEVVVVKGRTGSTVAAGDVGEIEPGDMIIVPYKPIRSWRETLQAVSLVTTTVAALVLSYRAVFP